MVVELRRLTPVLGFAAGFAACLLFLNLSGISSPDDAARAYPNPAPNVTAPAAAPEAPAHPPLFPTPRYR